MFADLAFCLQSATVIEFCFFIINNMPADKYKQFLENDFSTIYRQNIYSWLHGLDDGTIRTVERIVNPWYTRYTRQPLDENNNGLKYEVAVSLHDIGFEYKEGSDITGEINFGFMRVC